MVYKNILKATFKNRPNRFIAECIIDNQEAIVHVKNTGRCRELLVPDAEVYLEYFPESSRKTKYRSKKPYEWSWRRRSKKNRRKTI